MNDELSRRLDRLERTCRRWRRAGIAFALLAGTPIALLFLAFLMSDGINEAKGLIIRDKEGMARIDLGTAPDGSPMIVFRGGDGKIPLELSLDKANSPTIRLDDKAGTSRLSMTVGENGPFVWLKDKAGADRLELAVDGDDSPSVKFYDKVGKARLRLHADPGGEPRVDLVGEDEKLRLTVVLGKDDRPAIGLMDKEGKVRLSISLDTDGKPVIIPARP